MDCQTEIVTANQTQKIEVVSQTPPLYQFTSFTFHTCGKSGAQGPTLAECRSSYQESDLMDFFGMTDQGIQEWTVPETANYQIEVRGAQGGNTTTNAGGRGALMRGYFDLTRGQKLKILVGQKGGSPTSTYGGGGGGGSFVVDSNNDTPLIIAGGGGGANNLLDGAPGQVTTYGTVFCEKLIELSHYKSYYVKLSLFFY